MKNATKAFPGGKYMNAHQLDWFLHGLQAQLEECNQMIDSAPDRDDQAAPEGNEADVADYKIQSAQQDIAANRLHAMKREIIAALARIDSGEFGYCEDRAWFPPAPSYPDYQRLLFRKLRPTP